MILANANANAKANGHGNANANAHNATALNCNASAVNAINVIANNANGTRKRKIDDNRVAQANGNSMSFKQIGFTMGTVAAKYAAAARIA